MLRKRAGLFATVMIKLEFHFAPMLTRIRQFLKSIHNSATPITLLHFFAIMLLLSFWRVLWVWQLRDLIPENSTEVGSGCLRPVHPAVVYYCFHPHQLVNELGEIFYQNLVDDLRIGDWDQHDHRH